MVVYSSLSNSALESEPGILLIQGYGLLLCLAVVFGSFSLGCQSLMTDVNPQEPGLAGDKCRFSLLAFPSALSSNFGRFLIYFGFWTFAANLSSPFFNLCLLDDLRIDSNNIQMSIAPTSDRATYFRLAAAVAGIGGASATIAGGFVAQFAHFGGLPGLFALSAVLRLVALLPLVFVQENSSHPIDRVIQSLKQSLVSSKFPFPSKTQLIPALVKVTRE